MRPDAAVVLSERNAENRMELHAVRHQVLAGLEAMNLCPDPAVGTSYVHAQAQGDGS